jgi:hypothetical protein
MIASEVFVTCAVTGGARVLDATQTRERSGLLERRQDARDRRHARVR